MKNFCITFVCGSALVLATLSGEAQSLPCNSKPEVTRTAIKEIEAAQAKGKGDSSGLKSLGIKKEAAQPPLADAPSYTKREWTLRSVLIPSASDNFDYLRMNPPVNPIINGPSLIVYTPLTSEDKFDIFVKSTYSPYTFLSAGFDAGLSQATDGYHGYGQGAEGYGKRLGAALANSESGVFFGKFLFPLLLHQDPRYFQLHKGSIRTRALYAVSRVFITRDDDGRSVFNTSYILGSLASRTLSNAYYPRQQRSIGNTFSRTGNALLSDAGSYLFQEFWPDISGKFVPKRLRRYGIISRAADLP